mmetsp:Transcript_32449/g.69106  ORF Transcript_32449/g.69106 Transcript_32449/m.69106 type:complete len:103 (+) Transcript_32449:262-570(+)
MLAGSRVDFKANGKASLAKTHGSKTKILAKAAEALVRVIEMKQLDFDHVLAKLESYKENQNVGLESNDQVWAPMIKFILCVSRSPLKTVRRWATADCRSGCP